MTRLSPFHAGHLRDLEATLRAPPMELTHLHDDVESPDAICRRIHPHRQIETSHADQDLEPAQGHVAGVVQRES